VLLLVTPHFSVFTVCRLRLCSFVGSNSSVTVAAAVYNPAPVTVAPLGDLGIVILYRGGQIGTFSAFNMSLYSSSWTNMTLTGTLGGNLSALGTLVSNVLSGHAVNVSAVGFALPTSLPLYAGSLPYLQLDGISLPVPLPGERILQGLQAQSLRITFPSTVSHGSVAQPIISGELSAALFLPPALAGFQASLRGINVSVALANSIGAPLASFTALNLAVSLVRCNSSVVCPLGGASDSGLAIEAIGELRVSLAPTPLFVMDDVAFGMLISELVGSATTSVQVCHLSVVTLRNGWHVKHPTFVTLRNGWPVKHPTFVHCTLVHVSVVWSCFCVCRLAVRRDSSCRHTGFCINSAPRHG
jgi:hypothetical protein